MVIKKMTTELVVFDVKKTVEYYEKLLGFKLTNKVEIENIFVWASMESENGEVELMFTTKDAMTEDVKELGGKEIGGTIALYFEITELDSFYEKIKLTENIVMEKRKTNYGSTEFAIKDLDGYVLMFSERA